jgi:superfamily II DNA/RNA helicase
MFKLQQSLFLSLFLFLDKHSTARGHRAGVALSFVTPEDRPQLRLVKVLLADEMDAAATAALKAEQEHSGAPAADPDEPLCSILKPYTLKVGSGACE